VDIGQLRVSLTDVYPTTPHVLFTTLKKLDTNLNDLHLSFGRVEETKNNCPQLKAQRELLEAKHLFTATMDSKWDPITFLNWTHDLRNLVLDHFTNFKANDKGSFYVPKTLLEAPSRNTWNKIRTTQSSINQQHLVIDLQQQQHQYPNLAHNESLQERTQLASEPPPVKHFIESHCSRSPTSH